MQCLQQSDDGNENASDNNIFYRRIERMVETKKANKAEQDQLTSKLPGLYKRKCQANGMVPHKIIRERLEGAQESNKLQALQLWEDLGPVHIRLLMDTLSDLHYPHLKKIRFWKTDAQDEGLRAICIYIQKVGCLEYLDLMDNKITALGCEFLGKALCHPRCKINKLRLDNNPIGDEGLCKLAMGLRENQIIEKLSFMFCGITAIGVKYIQEIMAHINCKLRTLKLMGNPLGNQGVYEVLRAVNSCGDTLQKLNLADVQMNLLTWNQDLGDTIQEKIQKQISSILKNNSTIAKYSFKNNWIPDAIARKMLNQIKDNKNIFIIELPQCISHGIKEAHAEIMKKRKPKKKKKGKGKQKK